jgi:hypothetical protein
MRKVQRTFILATDKVKKKGVSARSVLDFEVCRPGESRLRSIIVVLHNILSESRKTCFRAAFEAKKGDLYRRYLYLIHCEYH